MSVLIYSKNTLCLIGMANIYLRNLFISNEFNFNCFKFPSIIDQGLF